MNTSSIKQFSYKDIRKLNGDCKCPFWFECSMVSACEPLFPQHWDNHDVEDVLIKNGVIRDRCYADSECCALVVNFESRKEAETFIDLLNAYLIRRAKQVTE